MQSQRSTKSRSLGISPQTRAAEVGARLKRPVLGERHQSAPSIPGSRPSQVSQQQAPEDPQRLEPSAPALQASSQDGLLSRVTGRSEARRSLRTFHLEPIPLLKVVVLGNPSVGKSSFIRHALDLDGPLTSLIASSRLKVHGVPYRVQITELDLDEVDIEDGRHIIWPTYVENLPFSSPDAVICLYDITDADSIEGVPAFLAALANLDVPAQLVTSKTDIEESEHELDSSFADKVRSIFPHVQIAESSVASPENARQCLHSAINTFFCQSTSSEKPVFAGPASAAALSDLLDDHSDANTLAEHMSDFWSDVTSQEPLQASCQSEVRSRDEASLTSSDGDETIVERLRALSRLQTTDFSGNRDVSGDPYTPVSENDQNSRRSGLTSMSTVVPQTPDSYRYSNSKRPGTADSRLHHTFFNVEDESPEDDSTEDTTTEEEEDETSHHDRADGTVSFTHLVDNLLQIPTNKVETRFAPTFLCLYRLFATPQKLLVAIVDRFVKMEADEMQQAAKMTELLRYLQVMAQWTATYPGDFADAVVRELAVTFVVSIEKMRNFSRAAKEIRNNLQVTIRDPDADWACHESTQGVHSRTASLQLRSGAASVSTSNSDESRSNDGKKESRSPSRRAGGTSAPSELLRSAAASSQSGTNLVSLINVREQARRLRVTSNVSLCKTHWHFFMDTPTDDLARELTRIDWTMYSAIRPRDFVRYVTLPNRQRADDNISAMIKHFNHLALFVAGIVLLRDKPKHRAKALEKFMDLAWKVRQLNNYNSLAALVAGITSHEIARLGQTHELIPADIKKQFLRLTILMGSAKSYATYRMAWENSTKERIPFISTVLRDLTLAAGANQTFLGTHINWKKFEIMGDTIINIQRSYEHPYSFPDKTSHIQNVQKLFLEPKITDEPEDSADPHNELYNRSVQIEPQVAMGDSKKKFEWLRR